MSLTPTLPDVAALFEKLERERYRAFHCNDAVHCADHFFNFCVTAHSLRDHLFEYMGDAANKEEKEKLHLYWSAIPQLKAVEEIANSTKHCVLRKQNGKLKKVKTQAVTPEKTTRVNIYETVSGELRNVFVEVPSYIITLSDGTTLELSPFMENVIKHWRSQLEQRGVVLAYQSVESLIGE